MNLTNPKFEQYFTALGDEFLEELGTCKYEESCKDLYEDFLRDATSGIREVLEFYLESYLEARFGK